MQQDRARRRAERFLEAVNHGYEAARRSPEWEAILAERADWDSTLTDGLLEPLNSGSAWPTTETK
jgi:hypothetical protein